MPRLTTAYVSWTSGIKREQDHKDTSEPSWEFPVYSFEGISLSLRLCYHRLSNAQHLKPVLSPMTKAPRVSMRLSFPMAYSAAPLNCQLLVSRFTSWNASASYNKFVPSLRSPIWQQRFNASTRYDHTSVPYSAQQTITDSPQKTSGKATVLCLRCIPRNSTTGPRTGENNSCSVRQFDSC
jgi:hypothetical protein